MNRIAISPASQWIALSLGWPNDSAYEHYRVKVTDSSGHDVWTSEKIPPPSSGALAITLQASLFHSGVYALTLEGIFGSGRSQIIAKYRFRIAVAK